MFKRMVNEEGEKDKTILRETENCIFLKDVLNSCFLRFNCLDSLLKL